MREAIGSGGSGSSIASSEDIADVVCLFVPDQARFIAGQVILVR